jgi:transposase
MHLGVDIETLDILSVSLTGNNADDGSQLETLLNGIEAKIVSLRADGAYDKKKVRQLLSTRKIKQIITPQHNAVIKDKNESYAVQRNAAIKTIQQTSKAQWKKQTAYHKRSLAEVTMYRYKTIFGDHLQSRKIEYEKKEVALKCRLLNTMADLAMPKSYKLA